MRLALHATHQAMPTTQLETEGQSMLLLLLLLTAKEVGGVDGTR
jgi:hypothetical protein